ncbi:hypothetical protein DJ018_08985 [Phenylobacterium deserti]|uniref:Uncharacterized protein n=2 Tax=Phenylobacterium deserti TaxID=1914756 RepID=A0A328AUY3_9CAUL|nr:hypothetical protein DJ018_08985 [Phenylobacterium deserti]
MGQWGLQSSATAGTALAFTQQGQDVLRIACLRSPAGLYVASDRLPPSAGAARLQIGERVFTLTASATAEPRFSATAPSPPALTAALMSGEPVRLMAGSRSLAPLPAPDGKLAAAFSIACRATADG